MGITISSGPFRVDGGSVDYRLTFEVQGTQIIGGRVVKSGPSPEPSASLRPVIIPFVAG